jgi:DNA-binding IclR family transcriptional regulator
MPANDPLQSIQRAAQVLFAVAGAEEGRTVAEIAAAVGLKQATAYRIIRTLEAENFLHRRRHPLRFGLGPAVGELHQLEEERHLLSVAGRTLIRAQARLPHANFALMERQGTRFYQRLAVESTRPGYLVRRRSFEVPLYAKASSLLWLAYCPPDEVQALLDAHPFEREGQHVWRDRQALEDFLRKVRRLGYAQPTVMDEAVGQGPDNLWFRVAAPVFSPGGELLAAVGAYQWNDASREDRRRLVRLSTEAAAEITGALRQPRASE